MMRFWQSLLTTTMACTLLSPPLAQAAPDPQLRCAQSDAAGCVLWGHKLLENKDRKSALSAFTKGCDLGHAEGCFNAGLLHSGNEEQEFALYDRACRMGFDPACFLMVSIRDETQLPSEPHAVKLAPATTSTATAAARTPATPRAPSAVPQSSAREPSLPKRRTSSNRKADILQQFALLLPDQAQKPSGFTLAESTVRDGDPIPNFFIRDAQSGTTTSGFDLGATKSYCRKHNLFACNAVGNHFFKHGNQAEQYQALSLLQYTCSQNLYVACRSLSRHYLNAPAPFADLKKHEYYEQRFEQLSEDYKRRHHK